MLPKTILVLRIIIVVTLIVLRRRWKLIGNVRVPIGRLLMCTLDNGCSSRLDHAACGGLLLPLGAFLDVSTPPRRGRMRGRCVFTLAIVFFLSAKFEANTL